MKRSCVVLTALLLMVFFAETAFADVAYGPLDIVMEYGFPVFLIAVAVIVIVLVIRAIRNNKSKDGGKDSEK